MKITGENNKVVTLARAPHEEEEDTEAEDVEENQEEAVEAEPVSEE